MKIDLECSRSGKKSPKASAYVVLSRSDCIFVVLSLNIRSDSFETIRDSIRKDRRNIIALNYNKNSFLMSCKLLFFSINF
jgi:hypothetical protein